MSMTDAERTALGQAAKEARRVRFGDSKKRVYDAADVNPATLDRVEQGERVRADTLAAVVRTLWPASEGDWRRVLAAGSPSPTMPAPATGLDDFTDAQLAVELARRLTGGGDTTVDVTTGADLTPPVGTPPTPRRAARPR